jgi:hypothetical protein
MVPFSPSERLNIWYIKKYVKPLSINLIYQNV